MFLHEAQCFSMWNNHHESRIKLSRVRAQFQRDSQYSTEQNCTDGVKSIFSEIVVLIKASMCCP